MALVAGAVGVGALVVASVAVGSRTIAISTIFEALVDYDRANFEHAMIRDSRLARALLGMVVGAMLAVAGVMSQSLTRNPLGSPDILGVNAGAAFAVVTALYVGGVDSTLGLASVGVIGALAVSAAVALLAAASRGGMSPARLVLAGIILTALIDSWTSFVLVSGERTLLQARSWLVGSLSGRSLDTAVLALLLAAPLLAAAMLLARQLNLLALGDDVATALGIKTKALRVKCLLLTVVMCGVAVAACGPIAFVALAAPHIVRRLSGNDYRWFLPLAALTGAGLLLAADVIGRLVLRPNEVDVGVVTALLGAPFLLVLVRRLSLGTR